MIIPTHPTYWGRVFNEPKITFSAELPPAQQKSATRRKNYLSYPPAAPLAPASSAPTSTYFIHLSGESEPITYPLSLLALGLYTPAPLGFPQIGHRRQPSWPAKCFLTAQ